MQNLVQRQSTIGTEGALFLQCCLLACRGINNKDEKRTFCTKVLEQHVTVWLVRCAKYCEDAGGIDK